MIPTASIAAEADYLKMSQFICNLKAEKPSNIVCLCLVDVLLVAIIIHFIFIQKIFVFVLQYFH